ncbi:MAG: hypothetical protein COA58_12170 [Bacteroidetes bacterium]|nr:MAG: hypothetical protein COA58_12170 [Bacteroidota bacterium]
MNSAHKHILVKCTFFLLALLPFQLVLGQLVELKEVNSFYMGKQNTLSVGCPLYFTEHPNKSNPEAQNGQTGMSINVFPQLNFTHAFSNGLSIRILYSRDITSRNQDHTLGLRQDNGNAWLGEIGTPKYTRNSFGITFNGHFKDRGNLAPIGNHISFGARVHFVNSDFSNNKLNPSLGTEGPLSLIPYEQDYTYLTLDAGYTYRTMLSKKLFWDMSVNAALPLHIQVDPYTEKTSEDRLNKGIYNANKKRFKTTDFAGLYLGLGIVI